MERKPLDTVRSGNMKIYTILKNLVQSIKSSLAEAKDYADARGDYIVEEGKSGIWYYKKWASGEAECWGKNSVVSVIRTAWGSIYQTSPNNIGGDTYPSNLFIEAPDVWISIDWLDAACMPFTATTGTATKAPTYGAIRGTQSATSGVSVRYYLFAKGLWKTFEQVGGVIHNILTALSGRRCFA